MVVHTAPETPRFLKFGSLNNGLMFRVVGDTGTLYIKDRESIDGLNARQLHPRTGARARVFAPEDPVEIVDIVDVTVEVKRRYA